MIDPAQVPAVEPGETLARFVLFSKHFRSNNTIRPEAFIPPKNLALSVTRHLLANDQELWELGQNVAIERQKTLYGRADVLADVCLKQSLTVNASPISRNPNHADIKGWPNEKDSQLILAQEIAAAANWVPRNPTLGDAAS
jgi:hypothetical protein